MKPRYLIDAHVHLNVYHEAERRPTRENVADLEFEGEQLESIAWRTASRLFRIDVETLPRRGPGPDG